MTCTADQIPQRVLDAITDEHNRPAHDDGHTACFYAGLFLVGFEALLRDDDAMSRLRHAYLTSPPHGVKHDDAGRRAHMRAALVAALRDDRDAA